MKLWMNHQVFLCSMKVMLSDDAEFLSELPRNFHGNYKLQKKSRIEKINHEWSKTSLMIKRKSRAILEDTYHKEVLNSCIFPFVQQGSITQKFDYSYLRSSPLSELGLKNVDFLIASRNDRVMIFGEAKGTIADPRAVISEYKTRIAVIEKNIEHVKTIFPELRSLEYVLGVQSGDAVEMSKAILRSNVNIILWQISRWDTALLSLVVPLTNDTNQRRRVMHRNDALNKTLSDVPTSTAFKTFYHESHPVTKMALLTSVNKGSQTFTFGDFKTLVIEELDNSSEEEITRITRQIFESAIDIGFVKSLDDGTYKIQSRFKNSRNRYEELKKKWIARRIEIDKENAINELLRELQNQFRAQKRSLDEF